MKGKYFILFKLYNLKNIEGFIKVIDTCEGNVYIVSK